MILAVVDDLFFLSRIRTTAASLGAPLVVARSVEEAVDQARRARPSRLLLDLNSRAVDALSLIRRFKDEPALSGVPIVGFVSHVQKDTIAAARAAGIDDVLARSAFVSRLPDLLTP